MKIGVFLLAMVDSLVAKVLLSLGFSVVTVTGLQVVTSQLKQQGIAAMGGLGSEMAALFSLAGGPEGMGIILGACATKILLWQIQSSTKILGTNPAS